ncbi:MAG: hypothetical protein Tsb002_21130 [Wenzhouxiangellaceae bacterium]
MASLGLDLLFWNHGEPARALSQCLRQLGHDVREQALRDAHVIRPSGARLRLLFVDNQAEIGAAELLQHSGDTYCQMLIGSCSRMAEEDQLLCPTVEFCLWPCHSEELDIRLQRLASLLDTQPPASATGWRTTFPQLIGESPAFRQSLQQLEAMARSGAPVLICGETGTGKELVAKAIHQLSPRAEACFADINCGALPEHLLENELFGHAKGAYTDAGAAQSGLLAQADGGTLFLDEIDGLPMHGQRAMLRFLQDGSYRPLGLGRSCRASVRVIAATNTNLEQQVKLGNFRSDLYYRLNLLAVKLPPLRQRQGDILLLARHFLKRCEKQYGLGGKSLHPLTLSAMQDYHWPGNVRELENFIARSYLMSPDTVIISKPLCDAEHISNEAPPLSSEIAQVQQTDSFQQAKQVVIDQFERDYLEQLMLATAGNVSRAAELAGKERRALGKLLKKHGISREDYRCQIV